MAVDITSLEFALAAKHVKRLDCCGTSYGEIINRTKEMIVSQGYGEQHALEVAQTAYDLVLGD